MSPTPNLVVDLDVLDRNIAAMAARAQRAGVALRPHVKTHKIPQMAEMQRAAGAQGITVATIGEAEVFVRAGFDDVFIAYPLWLDDDGAARLAALSDKAQVSIGVDSTTSARNTVTRLTAAGAGSAARPRVLIELDSGHHRTGASPHEAGELATAVQSIGLKVDGLFTFPGHSYGPDARAAAAVAERETLAAGAASLHRHGFDAAVRSGGSSPSMEFVTPSSNDTDPTEVRPGAYIFNDAQQWELGACGAEDIALTVHATVVSHSGGRASLDSGSKALGADKAPWATGFGRLLDHPDARIVQLSEHHAVVDMAGEALPPLGSTVRVVPNHCCNTVNLANEVTAVRGGSTVEVWPVAARGQNA